MPEFAGVDYSDIVVMYSSLDILSRAEPSLEFTGRAEPSLEFTGQIELKSYSAPPIPPHT